MPPTTAPAIPFPGAAPTGDATAKRGVVVGGYAECSLFGAVVANLFDWEVKPVFDYSNLTAHGDYWQVNVFLDAGWTARARGYLTLLGATYMASGALVGVDTAAHKIPTLLTFTGYSTLAAATGGGNPKVVWAGSCYIKDFTLMVPNELVTQEINVIGTSTPSTIG